MKQEREQFVYKVDHRRLTDQAEDEESKSYIEKLD